MKKLIVILCLSLLLAGCGGPWMQEETVPETIQEEETVEITEPTEAETIPGTQAETQPETIPPETVPETLPTPEDDELVRVLDYIPNVRQELAYATEDNFTGQKIYDFYDAYLRYGTVRRLTKVSLDLAQQGLGLVIWDGYRPVSAQAKLWEICPDTTYVSHPVTGGRAHCRGSAVDVTLYSLETGELLPMPTGFDDFSKLADRNYSDCPEEAAANARILEDAMKEYGFRPYSAEWWHFSDPDSYPVEEEFVPAAG